jgi:heat-inducible transcriptional repressor
VRGSLLRAAADPDTWARHAASILSDDVRNVGIATTPRVKRVKLKQLQLVHLQDNEALMVAVLQDATIRQRLVHLETARTQDDLTAIANRLNTILGGKSSDEIRTAWDADRLPNADDTIITEVLTLLTDEEHDDHLHQYTQGLHHILNQPEFESTLSARDAVEVLESGIELKRIIIERSGDSDLEVIIGEENPEQTLRPYSVVLARYGNPGEASGVIGTIGPTRMDYTRAISSVRYLATFLGGLLAALDDDRPS